MKIRIALKWGVLLGVAVCVWTLGLHALGWYTTDLAKGKVADQVATILPVIAIGMAMFELRRSLGGRLPFGAGVGTGMLTGLVSAPISAGFLWMYHHYINPRWLDLLVEFERSQMTAQGKTADEITKRIDALTAAGTDSAQIFGAIIGTLIISIVISVLVWTVFRLLYRPRPTAADVRPAT